MSDATSGDVGAPLAIGAALAQASAVPLPSRTE
jgi:hypothetical protein